VTAPVRQSAPTTPYPGRTFLQLQQDTLAVLNIQTTDADATLLAQVKSLLNEAVAQLNLLGPGLITSEKYAAITTVAAQADYLAPLGLVRILDPIMLDGAPVYSIPRVYENRAAQGVGTGGTVNTTQYYSIFGFDNAAGSGTPDDESLTPILTFHPAPTAAGTAAVWYHGLDNALAADTDLIRIPPAFSSAPVWYAKIPLLFDRGRVKEASSAKTLWDDALGRMKNLALRSRIAGETLIWPNFQKSGRGRRYKGTAAIIP
jgi:hypothetical protein